MPSGTRTRRKDDTWTTDELNRALKRDDPDRKRPRDRDDRDRRHRDDDDRRRKHKDDVNGDSDDRRRRHKEDDRKTHRDASEDKRRHKKDRSPDARTDLTEEERERQRQERRERREKKEPSKPDKKDKRKDAPVKDDDDDVRRRHRDRDDDTRKHRDDDRERQHKDDDRRRNRDGDDRRRQRDDDRRRHKDDEDSRRRHKEDDNKRRHKEEDGRDKKRRERHEDVGDDRERQRQERREKKEKKDGNTRKEDEKKDRGKEEKRRRDGDEEKQTVSRKKKDTEPEPDEKEEGNDYNYEDEEFEDYDDDFEDEDEVDDNKPKESLNEMDALMRAMDEENNRVTNGSQRSLRSDETDDSEDRYKPPAPKANHGRTFIDFVSAKQVALNSKTASRTKKRGEDLLQMIELDKARYDMFDLPPVREYEMYIRSFGRSNTKQAYVQTNEDNIERDIQTDDIDTKEKWTQHPSDDLLGVGGDGIDPEAAKDNQIISRHGDTVKLAKFVEKVGQTMGMLLDEEREGTDRKNLANTKSNVGFSDGFNELGRPKFVGDRHVTHASFCLSQPNMLLTVFSSPNEPSMDNPVDSHGLICAWNNNDLSYPHRILCCEAQPVCCCFSPTRASLAFCGMLDGSVVVWDLREAASMHRTVTVVDQEHVLRFPTYNTARVLEDDNHHSPVTTIIPVYSTAQGSKSEDSSDTSTGLSFQLATVEQNGVVNLWVVTEITSPDMAGSEVDLGLAPGGRVKLLKSSSIVLQSPSRSMRSKGSVQAFEMQFLPSDLNHFYVGTDTGCVLHGVRFRSRGYPHGYTPFIESPVNVTTIDFSPFGSPYLLAGCDDGSLYLYHTKSENPLLSWPVFCKGCGVRCVRWSRSRPTVFYVLDESSTLHVMDLLESDATPIQRDQITPGRVVTMCLTSDGKLSGAGSSKSPQMLLALDNGRTEVHTIIRKLTEMQTLEEDYMEKYIDKF